MTREEINEKRQREIFKEQNKETIKNVSKKVIKWIFIIIILGTSFFAYVTYVSTLKISVREYRIINKKIPETFNGVKIIQFSDLHYGSTMFDSNLDDIKKIINERKPDLLFFTGDLIDKNYKMSSKDTEILTKKLMSLDASLGKYAILGNEDDDEITTIFNQANFILLKNEYDLIYNDDNNPILLIGLSSLINNNQDIETGFRYFDQEAYNPDIYTVVLVHEPDSTIDIRNDYSPDIILSGHSHNGNIRLPFINYSIFKVNGAKKYDQNYYKINNTKLYVSSGLGTNNLGGIRLFCRPSINFYRLSNK